MLFIQKLYILVLYCLHSNYIGKWLLVIHTTPCYCVFFLSTSYEFHVMGHLDTNIFLFFLSIFLDLIFFSFDFSFLFPYFL